MLTSSKEDQQLQSITMSTITTSTTTITEYLLDQDDELTNFINSLDERDNEFSLSLVDDNSFSSFNEKSNLTKNKQPYQSTEHNKYTIDGNELTNYSNSKLSLEIDSNFDFYDIIQDENAIKNLFSENSCFLCNPFPTSKPLHTEEQSISFNLFRTVPLFKDLHIIRNDMYRKNSSIIFFDKHYDSFKSNSIIIVTARNIPNIHEMIINYYLTSNISIMKMNCNELSNSSFLKHLFTIRSMPIDFVIKYHLYTITFKLVNKNYLPDFIIENKQLKNINNKIFIKCSVCLSEELISTYKNKIRLDKDQKKIYYPTKEVQKEISFKEGNSSNKKLNHGNCRKSRKKGIFVENKIPTPKVNKHKELWVNKQQGILKRKFHSINDYTKDKNPN
jgi:hypothetical protein